MSVDFEEVTKHLSEDREPSKYFNMMVEIGGFKEHPYNLLQKLKEIPQEKRHHPEGSVWNHTMMVIDCGAKLRDGVKNKRVFMWGLLLHDIGKITTTKKRNGRWTSYNHDYEGEKIGREFLYSISCDKDFIDEVCKIIKYHMHYLYITKKLPFGEVEKMKIENDLNELKNVFLSDRLGRGNLTKEEKEKITEEIKSFTL